VIFRSSGSSDRRLRSLKIARNDPDLPMRVSHLFGSASTTACDRHVGFLNSVTWSELGLLRGSFVLVDQPVEDGPAFDPLAGQVNDGTVGAWGLQLQRPMGGADRCSDGRIRRVFGVGAAR
jgi:hypothetical protein